MKRSCWLSLVLVTTALAACQTSGTTDHGASTSVSAPSSSSAPSSAAPTAAPSLPANAGLPADAGPLACRAAKDCAEGETCHFKQPGCDVVGECVKGPAYGGRCNIAIPMCSCANHTTFFGQGGCAGNAAEPWELYACTCSTDADCRQGQVCVETTAGRPHKADATRECRDKKP